MGFYQKKNKYLRLEKIYIIIVPHYNYHNKSRGPISPYSHVFIVAETY